MANLMVQISPASPI